MFLAIALSVLAVLNLFVGFWSYGSGLSLGVIVIALSLLAALFPSKVAVNALVPVLAALTGADAITRIYSLIHTSLTDVSNYANYGVTAPSSSWEDYVQLVISLLIAGLAIFWLLIVLGAVKLAPAPGADATTGSVPAGSTVTAVEQTTVVAETTPATQAYGQATATGYGDAQASGKAQAPVASTPAAAGSATPSPSAAGYGQSAYTYGQSPSHQAGDSTAYGAGAASAQESSPQSSSYSPYSASSHSQAQPSSSPSAHSSGYPSGPAASESTGAGSKGPASRGAASQASSPSAAPSAESGYGDRTTAFHRPEDQSGKGGSSSS